jgi:peptidoglycan/LPS O-acetylase OafA/YrhL
LLDIISRFRDAGRGWKPRRYYTLDGLRGLAAIAVLFWHYQHFFFPPGKHLPVADFSEHEPLHWLFAGLYDYGNYAVPLFWVISGFVFSNVYGGRETRSREFWVNRLARLYPLHLLTLVLVASLQPLCLAIFGSWVIYGHNDALHFALQLAFASNWFLTESSFNGPIWSVSVEILAYAFFWFVHRRLFALGAVLPLAMAAGGVLFSHFERTGQLGTCLFYFFVGAASFAFWRQLRHSAAAAAASALLLIDAGIGWAYFAASPLMRSVGLAVAFAGSLLLLAGAEDRIGPRLRGLFGFLGDNSYGMYLWHIPTQLALTLLLRERLAVVAQSPWFLFAYLLVVAMVARVSFVGFERPARIYLRRFAGKRGGLDAPIAAP